MPARSIRLPANTKDGIASSTQLCDAAISGGAELLQRKAAEPEAGDAGGAEAEHDRQRQQQQCHEDEDVAARITRYSLTSMMSWSGPAGSLAARSA